MNASTVKSLAAAASFGFALAAQTPLAPPPAPPENPTTAAKAVLGKILFFEEQLSTSGRVACGTCHAPEAGGGDLRRRRHPGNDGVLLNADDTWGSPGSERRDISGAYAPDARFGFSEQVTPRAALSTTMAPWFPLQLWDGRIGPALVDPETSAVIIPAGASLEAQSLHPLRSEVEMAKQGRSWSEIRQRLNLVRPMALATNLPPDVQQAVAASPGYPGLFNAAFGDPAITLPRVAMALAAYQRSTVPNQTPWDLFVAGNPNALTPDQQAGLALFEDEARCNLCHSPGLFTDLQFRALGVVPIGQDPGRGGVTGQSSELGQFKVPSLRNVALKSTFLHNGRFTNLTQVINFYRNGGGAFPPRDSLLQPIALDPLQEQQLLDFLQNGLVDPRARLRLPPFDRPTLHGATAPVGSNLFGGASAGGGFTPDLLAQSPPFLGNPEWAIGFTQGPPNAVGFFVLGLLQAPAGAQLAGVTLNVEPNAFALILPQTLGSAGYGSLVLPVPFAPELRGLPLQGQGLFSTASGVWSGTRGATFVLR